MNLLTGPTALFPYDPFMLAAGRASVNDADWSFLQWIHR